MRPLWQRMFLAVCVGTGVAAGAALGKVDHDIAWMTTMLCVVFVMFRKPT